jgi:stringent starvation protein B
MTTIVMSSNRPYLLRAMYEWIADNGMTPYILVDAAAPDVDVPKSAIKDGRVVLNIAARAVAQLELGKDRVRFVARFSGVSQAVDVPMGAILAIYAQENGQGMMFPAEGQTPPPAGAPDSARKAPHLRVVK